MNNTRGVTSPEPILVQVRAESFGSVEVTGESVSGDGGDHLVSLTFGSEEDVGLVRVVGRRSDVHALVIEADRQLSRLVSRRRRTP